MKTIESKAFNILLSTLILRKLEREYTTNSSFSTGHKRWGWPLLSISSNPSFLPIPFLGIIFQIIVKSCHNS